MIVRSARPHINYSVAHNDIVTRLRHKYAGQLPICTEAADEIERLRAEAEALRKHIETLDLRIKTNRERIRRMEEGEL